MAPAHRTRQCDNAVATYRLAFLIILDIVSKKQDGDWSPRCRGVPECAISE